jgi:hypothetical protein
MTTYDDLDLAPDGADFTTLRLLADLERACVATIPPRRRTDIARRLSASADTAAASPPLTLRGAAGTRRMSVNRRRWIGRPRTRVASVAAAALVALAGTLGYLHLQNPSSVSAAELLHRAAHAVGDVAPGQVVHEVVRDGSITHEQWTQVNADGNPMRIDLRAGSPNTSLKESLVADAQGNLWTITGPNQVYKSTWTPGTPLFQGPPPSDPEAILFLPKQTINRPQDPGAMRRLLLTASQGSDGQTRLMPRQTIDGRTVDVIEVSRKAPSSGYGLPQGVTTNVLTIYLDDSTYRIRRIDWRGVNDSGATVQDWLLDITTYEVVPLSAVPSGTFAFTPSPGTQVCTPTGQSVGGGPGAVMPAHPVSTCAPAGRPPSG